MKALKYVFPKILLESSKIGILKNEWLEMISKFVYESLRNC